MTTLYKGDFLLSFQRGYWRTYIRPPISPKTMVNEPLLSLSRSSDIYHTSNIILEETTTQTDLLQTSNFLTPRLNSIKYFQSPKTNTKTWCQGRDIIREKKGYVWSLLLVITQKETIIEAGKLADCS